MASPFHVFRKHQKILVATLGLLAIGAFVFLPMALKLMPGYEAGSAGENPIVVTTKYGNLTQRDIESMQGQRRRLHGFFNDLVKTCCADNQFVLRQNLFQVSSYFGNPQEEVVVMSWLLTQRAKELGMQVDDEAVEEFIKSITNNNIDGDAYEALLNNYHMADKVLFSMLRQELLAIYFDESIRLSFLAETPAQRWNQFQRLYRDVSAQVSPVVAADFVKDVPEPTEKEIKDFFEKNKDVIMQPGSPASGFRIAEMADIQYLKANYDQFANPESVTDEEIEKYYNENRENYKKVELPGLEESLGPSNPLQGLPGSGIDTGKSPATETPNPETPNPEITPPAIPEIILPTETPVPTTEKPEPSTSSVTRSRFHLVSMQDDEAPKDEAPKPETTSDKPADTPVTTEPKEKTPKTGSNLAPLTVGSNLSELKNTSPNAPTTLSGNYYKPLEEVKDSIRSILASQKAMLRMQKELSLAKSKIEQFHRAVALSEDEKNPPTFDFAKLAKEHELTFNQTGLATALELRETEIGKSIIDGTYQTVAGVIIESTHDEELRNSMDTDLNQYLFWRVEKTEAKTPKLDDEGVREKVVNAWKEVQSRDLAMKEANQLAELARESKKTLSNSIAKTEGVTVRPTGSFSWYRYYLPAGTWQRTSVQLGDPANVVQPGSEFMEAVYSLQPKEVTTAMNAPRTIAYVIQLIDSDTSTEEGKEKLWKEFLDTPFENYAEVAKIEKQKAWFGWLNNLKAESGMTWKREPIRLKPDQMR